MNIDTAAADTQRQAFLSALEQGLSISGAATAAGVDRLQCLRWRSESLAFGLAWDEAVQAGVDRLEDVMLHRAVHGVEKPIFYRGQQVGVVMVYSDRLLALLLQRRRPATRETAQMKHMAHYGRMAARSPEEFRPTVPVPDPDAPERDLASHAVAARETQAEERRWTQTGKPAGAPAPKIAAEMSAASAAAATVAADVAEPKAPLALPPASASTALQPAAGLPPGPLARTELANTVDAVLSASTPWRMPRCVLEQRVPAADPASEALRALSDAELAKRLRYYQRAEARSLRKWRSVA